jgi:hypothetical protein
MKEHRNEKEQRQEGRMTKSDEGDKLSGMKASCGPTESKRIQPNPALQSFSPPAR